MSQELTEVQQKQVTKGLAPKLTERNELINSYNEVIKLPMNEENAKQFRELRLLLVKNRKEIEKWKTLEKAFYLAGGKFIQAIYNKEVTVNQDMEAKLLEGEQYAIRMEAERLEKIRSERWNKLQKFVEVEPIGLSTMEQPMFDALLLGSETTYNNRIEAEKKAELERLEVVRLDKLERDRINSIAPLKDFTEGQIDLRNCSDVEFDNYLDLASANKAKHEAKQKAIQEENERLKKANELKEKRAKELQPYIVFIRDYNGLISKPEAEYQKYLEDIKIGAQQHWEHEKQKQIESERLEAEKQKSIEAEKAKQEAILKKERDENNRLQAELQAKKDAELKEAKRLEELSKAPIKEQLNAWVDEFELPYLPTPHDKAGEIILKHEAFKKWAKSEIEKI